MNQISGQKDPVIKLLRELQSEDGRYNNGKFFADGEELVIRAFDYGAKIDFVILAESYLRITSSKDIITRCELYKIPVYICSSGLLGKIVEAKPIPECVAVLQRETSVIVEIFKTKSFVMMVESCENIDNLGMLLRTTDACNVDGVVLSGDSVDPFSRRVVRGSRGAVYTIPITIEKDCQKAINEAKSNGFQVVCTTANTKTLYTDINYSTPTMIIVGNEHTGISDAVRVNSDAIVKIPMLGKINSLNIAVAASVMMYEVVRQRAEKE